MSNTLGYELGKVQFVRYFKDEEGFVSQGIVLPFSRLAPIVENMKGMGLEIGKKYNISITVNFEEVE